MRIRGTLLVVATALLAGCSTPPGPPPATAAPSLPADAIAYDDLLSTDRTFPFTRTCEQLTSDSLEQIGARNVRDLEGLAGPTGCAVEFGTDTLDELWVEEKPPPNPSEPRYFPLMWNGDVGSTEYHRRLVLASRYYAVETIDFYGGQPGCYLMVDTGSPSALQFRGIVPAEYARGYGELNYLNSDYDIDHAGVQRFMTENCPTVERSAVGLLADIDPDGGSLATS